MMDAYTTHKHIYNTNFGDLVLSIIMNGLRGHYSGWMNFICMYMVNLKLWAQTHSVKI